MPDVFLSYSSKDRAAAERVQQALSARGIDVFWDQETPAGQDWDTWIRGKLNACKVAVVLWSRASVKSDNVRHEALVARKADKLLPAMIDPIAAEDLPMGLYMVQTVNLTDWRDAGSKGVAKLADEIGARVGKRAAPAAASAPAPKAAGGGLSPKAQTTVVLIGIAAVVAGAAWFMMQQQASQVAASVPEVSGATSTPAPGPTCLDGAVPTLGVCPNGQRAIPPAPVLGVGPGFSVRMAGRWNWDGVACADGPNVTLENGQLVFTAPGSRFVHAIDNDTDLRTTMRVVSCTGCEASMVGNAYVLEPEFFASSETRSFNLVVANTTRGTRDTWTPCDIR
jgi:hypothetical protein